MWPFDIRKKQALEAIRRKAIEDQNKARHSRFALRREPPTVEQVSRQLTDPALFDPASISPTKQTIDEHPDADVRSLYGYPYIKSLDGSND